MENPWSKYLDQYDWDTNLEDSEDELDVGSAQMSPEEMRHTGEVKYEKDPEFSIFRKKPPLPAAVSLTANSRASSSSGLFEGPYSSRASPSTGDAAFNLANQSPRIAEQFLGWPNSPHGAIQQLNVTNVVRVKPEAKQPKVVNNCKSGPVKTGKKIVPEILPSLLSPVEKDEPYNQTFSFSGANAISNSSLFNKPSTSSFDMPSTSVFDMPSTSSFNMPSTSFDLQSTSAYDLTLTSSYNIPAASSSSEDFIPAYEKPSSKSRGLMPCEPISAHQASFEQSFPAFQLPPTIAPATSEPQEKEPAIEKLVLRRVLQTDPKETAESGQSVKGLKGIAKNKKDSSQHYFMVVKKKDGPQDLTLSRHQTQKQANPLSLEKHKAAKTKESEETKKDYMINKLIKELESVKYKLELCNRNKVEYEQQLSLVKADLEKTKRITDYQTKILLKQKETFEKEIEKLKRANEQLSNSIALESAQMYRGIGNHPWNFADNHMSKQFQTIEEQKLEFQRRIEELECECRELKNSSIIERGRFDAKLRQYFKIMSELKRRLDEQTTKSEELQLQKDYFEKHIPPEIYYQVKNQLGQQQSEVMEMFPGLLTPLPTPPIASSPSVPLAETLLSEVQNVNYITFQSQMSPDSTQVFPHPQPPQNLETTEEEEIS
ncbi:hypothetical protein JTE90_012970 [Oedothorax gibbosus]|uniref:Uncharacterized protein n=1 Tax=Oedothorax gibbosus TaxID=931172 RepID=A0AAV6UAY8_9ARAC|nr:hypothetical protein JTE90_012970 [Oedothorax gibbosus]